MNNPKSNETSTFVYRYEDNIVHILHLFVFPNEDCNIFKSIIDGYGNIYVPNVDLDKPLKEQRFWSQGKLLAIFEGCVEENEVKVRLDSTGFITHNDEYVTFPCNRDGLEFTAKTTE